MSFFEKKTTQLLETHYTFDFKINAKKGKNAKKKAENIFSISKFIQKKSKTEKRKHTYLDFFAFISPVHFFAFYT